MLRVFVGAPTNVPRQFPFLNQAREHPGEAAISFLRQLGQLVHLRRQAPLVRLLMDLRRVKSGCGEQRGGR